MKLSVVIPVYNGEKYIVRCVDSILNHSDIDLECIIVDDGSIDQTLNICNELQKRDNRVQVIHTENLGVANARNTGLINSSGDYITFVDGDDFLDIELFEKLQELLTDDLDIVCYGIKRVSSDGITTHIMFEHKNIETDFLDYPEYMYSVCNKIFSSRLIKDNNISFKRGIKVCEDMLFSFEAFLKAKTIKFLSGDYYNYYHNPQSISYKKTDTTMLENYKSVYIYARDLCDSLNKTKDYIRFLNYRYMYYLMFYLTDIYIYSPERFRIENTQKLIWKYEKRFDLTLLSFMSLHHIDIFSRIYVGLKRIKYRSA